MRSLLKLAVVVIVGLLIYNTFFGTAEEKAQAKEIWGAGKSLVKSVTDLVKSEKDKYDEGKYDEAVANMTDWLEKAKKQAEEVGEDMPEKVADLQKKKDEIDKILAELKSVEETARGERSIDTPKEYDVVEPVNPRLNENLLTKLKEFASDVDEMEKRFNTTTIE